MGGIKVGVANRTWILEGQPCHTYKGFILNSVGSGHPVKETAFNAGTSESRVHIWVVSRKCFG